MSFLWTESVYLDHEPEKKNVAMLLNLENVPACVHSNIQIGYYLGNSKKEIL